MVTVGEEVLIEGFGFFPGDVFVEYSVDATPLSSVTVTADATGAFTTTITPAAGEEGLWTVEASDSSKGQCTDDHRLRGGWRARHSHADANASSHTDARSPGG